MQQYDSIRLQWLTENGATVLGNSYIFARLFLGKPTEDPQPDEEETVDEEMAEGEVDEDVDEPAKPAKKAQRRGGV